MSTSTPNEDAFQVLREAYGQVVDSWSSAMEQVVTTDEFAAASGRFLKQYADMTEAGRAATRTAADGLHLATKDDVARVAELVVNVERKVDEVSDEANALRKGLDAIAKMDIGGLGKRLDAIEAAIAKLSVPQAGTAAAKKPAAKKTPASRAAKKPTSGSKA